MVAHIFNPSDGILSTSPDTKPKIEFLQSSEELREIHFGSRNNLVEIEKGLASNPHCNVFGAVGRLENPGDQRLIRARPFEGKGFASIPAKIWGAQSPGLKPTDVFGAGALGNSENPGDRK